MCAECKEEVVWKVCSKCGLSKPITEFAIQKGRKDGHGSICKSCTNARNNRKAGTVFLFLAPTTACFCGKGCYNGCPEGVVVKDPFKLYRVCTKCGEEKEIEEFYAIKDKWGVYTSWCKECTCFYERWKREVDYKAPQPEILPEGMKRCTLCLKVLPFSDFSKRNQSKDGLAHRCRSCCKILSDKFVSGRREHEDAFILPESKVCTNCNRELPIDCFSKYLKGKYGRHAECRECRNAANRLRKLGLNFLPNPGDTKLCRGCNEVKDESCFYRNRRLWGGLSTYCKSCVRERFSELYKNDLEFHIRTALRGRTRRRLKKALNNEKHISGEKLIFYLNCTVEELISYLESLFYDNPETGEKMTWENYGRQGWHIDHVMPLAKFDLSDETQVALACRKINLQPLWRKDNLRKGAKLPEEWEAYKLLLEKTAEKQLSEAV